MSKHLCHWTRKDMRRAASVYHEFDVEIEHVIVLDLIPEKFSFNDPLEDLFEDAEGRELEAVFGAETAEQFRRAEDEEEFIQCLHYLGGFLVLGYFRPPDKEDVSLNKDGEVSGYRLACYQRPCRAWSPRLHTAIGKCLAQAARTKRDILRVGREIALRKREA